MPGGDRTGPLGLGPGTGRAGGYCAGYGVPGYMNPVPGRGFRAPGGGWFGYARGRGGGRPWRNWFYAGEEREMLRQEAEALKQELEDVQSRIRTLEKVQKEEK